MRSPIRNSDGLKITSKKKRDKKARASVHIEQVKPKSDRSRVHYINDGDPTVYGSKHGSAGKGTYKYQSKGAANPNKLPVQGKVSRGSVRSLKANIKRVEKRYPHDK